MSDNKETKKKGFFSRLLGGSDTVDTSNALEKNEVKEDSKSLSRAEEVASAQGADDIPNAITEPSKPKVNTLSKSALSKMKKADIVSAAAELGLELDIKLTKEKLLESWNKHFNQQEIVDLKRDLKVAEDKIVDQNTRLTSAESTWQMAENLYRQLADQVREHDYDIKDLNR